MSEQMQAMIEIAVDEHHTVSGLIDRPTEATAVLVLAHGAGAGMTHAFMADVATGLAARRIAVLRYQFPYMDAGTKRPDPSSRAEATVRAAVAAAGDLLAGLPLFAGGKSFGGRMTSQAQAASPCPGLRGLVFFGFPLHAANKPSMARADHLARVDVPMLFLQGARDTLADIGLVGEVIAGLKDRAELSTFDEADHSFHVPKRCGRTDTQVMEAMLDVVRDWIGRHV